MTSIGVHKRISKWWDRLYVYREPEPLPHSRSFWIATGAVACLAAAFSAYFIMYLTLRHAAYMTNAEDLGIMDQAIWTTLHGNLLHQTICNATRDTNCNALVGVTRFAIHFEPILFPVSLFYLLWPDPRTLLVIQTLVVATGAFPAFWLARLRIRNEWAAVVIALLYLLYPAQQYATVSDFHAVTFTASLLLFMLYFMYTRRTGWLFVFAILAMACKEEIPALVACYGLWSMLFQRRWRSGLGLVALGIVGTVLALLFTHLYSPTGAPLLASRYAYLGKGPVQVALAILLHPVAIIKQHMLEAAHLFYIRGLLAPAGYLPLLAPWVLVLAVPTLGLNMLSSDKNMYSGLYQYNAEIVPVLIFATIEAIVLLIWVFQWLVTSVELQREAGTPLSVEGPSSARFRIFRYWGQLGLLIMLLSFVTVNVARADYAHSSLPLTQGFQWPEVTGHTLIAQRFIDMIPPTASVSAQSSLVPHLSQRVNIYLFPYNDDHVDYIFLDVTSDVYPLFNATYPIEVKRVLFSGRYGVKAAQDGYILLEAGLPAPGIASNSPVRSGEDVLPALPDAFCSFVHATSQEIQHPVQVNFDSGAAPALNLAGYNVVAPKTIDKGGGSVQVTTYWQTSTPVVPALRLVIITTDSKGGEHFESMTFPGASWCPTTTWKPGIVYRLTSEVFKVAGLPTGLAHVSIFFIPLEHPYSTIMDDVQARLPVHVLRASGDVASTPGTNALHLAAITIVS